ncbi:MAG TPA: nicotinate-nucleotide--dimethylbenzimidazole phosphoribosyltransferase [Methanoculleus sp.]|nr:nicotinate-nucleotide--dimethylbenzimidazole phosphoribosyltransferase [Methanoculleus sp.]
MASRRVRGEEGHPPPAFVLILANTGLSLIPGLSGAGKDPEDTWKTPIRDAAYILEGGYPPLCPTPASVTRSCLRLCGISPLFVNAGLGTVPYFPCVTIGSLPGRDPRTFPAVPDAHTLYRRGRTLGKFLSRCTDTLYVGECVPGGTTTALCVLRALGYPARSGSAFPTSPGLLKEEIWAGVRSRLGDEMPAVPLAIVHETGDPMMAAACGLAAGFEGRVVLAGGTQMSAVAALMKAAGADPLPAIATTGWVRDDPDSTFAALATALGVRAFYAEPDIGPGAGRSCICTVKEGMGAGGAIVLAGEERFTDAEIADAIRAEIEQEPAPSKRLYLLNDHMI